MFSNPLKGVLSIGKSLMVLFAVVLVLLVACKKDKKEAAPPAAATRTELTIDSIFLYGKQIYMWYDKIPDYNTFNPRKYYNSSSKEMDNLEAELYALTRYGTNPSTNRPYEYIANSSGQDAGYPKYSYINDITDENPVAYIPQKKASVDLSGNGYDFGLRVGLYGNSNQDYGVYVEAVYPGSDAIGKVERGDRITTINNKTIGTDYPNEIDFIDNALFGSSASTVSLKITKRNGAKVDYTLIKKSYSSSPIYKDSIYTVGSKKIGYIAYARFSNSTNSAPEFTRIFDNFSSNGVTDLIVDLRYNGGGYVSTAELLMNLIAPSTLNGKVMYAEHFNALMQQKKATLLKNKLILNTLDKPQDSNHDGKLDTYFDVPYDVESNTYEFEKQGSLSNINSIVFIVSSSTASASELVINSLKAYMNVKIVGQKTYGKPVGFFPIRIDKYDVYLSMFESKNSKGEGGYFSGISPDYTVGVAAPVYPLGNINESSFKAALSYITTGTYISSSPSTSSVNKEIKLLEEPNGKRFGDVEFKGMIEDRIRIK